MRIPRRTPSRLEFEVVFWWTLAQGLALAFLFGILFWIVWRGEL